MTKASITCCKELEISEVGLFEDFTDKRNRTWEWFVDEGYYHMTCVRLKNCRKFNSDTSFHFDTTELAGMFVKLLRVST